MLSLLLATALAGPESSSSLPIGERVPDILLSSSEGARVGLYDLPFSDGRDFRLGVAIAFLDANGEQSAHAAQSFGALAEDYGPEAIDFVVLSTSGKTAAAAFNTWADEQELPSLRLMDPSGSAAELFEVRHRCEFFLLNSKHELVYHGALDDRYEGGKDRGTASEEWLAGAIESLLADEEPEVAQTPPTSLTRDLSPGPWSAPTFHEHIAPILNDQCVTCHRDGQIGPMVLTSFEEAQGWAPMIAEVVEAGRMPPWHADSRFGRFHNARRLTETEKALLHRWAEGGAPEGDPANAPPAPTFPSREWDIGTPDLVVELPEEEEVPATGVVAYRYIEVDPKLEEDRWVQAIQIRPTAPEVTHHALVLKIPPGVSMREALSQRAFLLTGHFSVCVPGQGPAVYPDGYGILLKAGTRFLFQMHYTPNGLPAKDRTRMALRWHDGEVEHPVLSHAVINPRIRIPPRTADVEFKAEYELPRTIRLLGLFPHMHARGTAFRFETETAFGQETILDVPHYDFNWQHTYYYTEPPILRSGTRMLLTAVYDNSESNPLNPDPSAQVFWGDQTFEEMLVGYLTYVEDVDPE